MVTKGRRRPRIGETVRVYWGLEEVEGEVVEVYGDGPLSRARVKVPVLGPRGEELDSEVFSLPFAAIAGF